MNTPQTFTQSTALQVKLGNGTAPNTRSLYKQFGK